MLCPSLQSKAAIHFETAKNVLVELQEKVLLVLGGAVALQLRPCYGRVPIAA